MNVYLQWITIICLLYFNLIPTIKGGTLSGVSFGLVVCQEFPSEKCRLTMGAKVYLKEAGDSIDETIYSYTNKDGRTMRLEPPLRITAKLNPKITTIRAQKRKDLYNQREIYDSIPDCQYAAHHFHGECADVPDSLCCLDSERPSGIHCIKYDYTQHYEQYLASEKTVNNSVESSIYFGSQLKGTFYVSNLEPRQVISGVGEVAHDYQESNFFPFDQFLYDRRNTIEEEEDLSPEDRWMFVQHIPNLIIEPPADKNVKLSCNTKENFLTHTHDYPAFQEDQFYELRLKNTPFRNSSNSLGYNFEATPISQDIIDLSFSNDGIQAEIILNIENIYSKPETET